MSRVCLEFFLAGRADDIAGLDCVVAVGAHLSLLYGMQPLFFSRYFSVAQQQHSLCMRSYVAVVGHHYDGRCSSEIKVRK